ncbi:O-antigen polymerase [Empedobacter sedimenti]|uniref:O-antigen polymerase n=1 Tax=Empedobacter sedimenti TaxID=3042610 RepID=UPI0024A61A97|nr:O-antigen polymerase [Empedobacter sedimenti]
MDVFLQIILLIIFLIYYKGGLSTYIFLILLQSISFFLQFFVGYSNLIETFTSVLNLLFIALNTYLIISPWKNIRFTHVYVKEKKYFLFLKRCLYFLLIINLLVNSFILIIVYTFIPNISEFKAESAYLKLYDLIPGFGNIFRYAYVTQNLGYLAIPFYFYYLGNNNKKKSRWALFLSFSSLLSGLAFYSRAQMLTYILVFISYFLLIKFTLNKNIRDRIWKFIKKASIIVVVIFVIITIIRFSAMDYYGDRIPKQSMIKDPILYSFVDYASQSFPNGFIKLEEYEENKLLYGQDLFRPIYQFLDFFGVIEWDGKKADENIEKAYNYDGGAFRGYTAQMVYNFGYIITVLISIIYYFIVKKYVRSKMNISMEKLFVLILLLIIPLVSIFYSGFGGLYFPFLFLFLTRLIFRFK